MKPLNKGIRLRTLFIGIIFSLFFAIIGGKAIYLQIFRAPWLAQKAANQYIRSIVSKGKRGTIYDANRREMAVSIDVTSIAAFPKRIQNTRATAKAVAEALDLKKRSIHLKLKSNKAFVWIKRHVTPREAKSLRALKLDGIDFISESSRFYPNRTLAAQVLGFTGIDSHGLEGIEYYYDSYLKGATTKQTILRDALGRGFDAGKKTAPNFGGNDLILTLDSTIQYIAEKTLAETATRFSAKSGIVIVMAPKTGAILALAHYPFFNPNAFKDFNKARWRNRAITDPFEPGSTMKIFSAAAALESGNVSPSTIFFCENGAYKIGKDVIHDIHARGWLSLQQIVKYSSNIGAAKIGEMIGPKYHYKMLRAFGFGAKTGIDGSGETMGTLFPYRKWSKIDAGAISFGQGISVSAIQLIAATSAIANDGILMSPYLVETITDRHGRLLKRMQPRKVKRAMSSKTAKTLNRIMQTVIHSGGTGVRAALSGYSVSGKTGTAQKTDGNGVYAKGKYIASFIGFAPAENPAIAILVVIDEPRGQYYGGIVAGPAFKKIARDTLSYLNIPPDKRIRNLTVSREAASQG